MKPSLRRPGIAVVLGLITGVTAAAACDCPPLAGPDRAREAASTVFAGEFLGIRDPIPLSVSVPDSEMQLEYLFRVERQWKGAHADTLRVRAPRRLDDCGLNFRFVDKLQVLVYAVDRDGYLWTDACTRTNPIPFASLDLYRLGKPVYDSGSGLVPDYTLDGLLEDLHGKAWQPRYEALKLLPEIHDPVDRIVPALVDLMRRGEEADQVAVPAALARFGADARSAEPDLVLLMKSKKASVRSAAADALGKVAAPLPRTVEVLVAAIRDDSPSVRSVALHSLGEVAPDDPRTDAAMVEAAGDRQPAVRGVAVAALGKPGADSTMVQALVRALDDPALSVRVQAAAALGRVGPDAKSAVPALRRATMDRYQVMQQAAEDALAAIRGRDKAGPESGTAPPHRR